MTPEERNLIIDLFDRLATLENAQRDPDAERLIRDGLRQAPNAPYALVQTVLVQDEALKRADERIRELEASSATETAARDTSFLGGMRDSLLGRREGRRSVPSVKPAEAGMSPAWQTGAPPMAAGAGSGGGAGSRTDGERRLVSRHHGISRGRRDRRLAASRRHSLHDGRSARRAGRVRSQGGRH